MASQKIPESYDPVVELLEDAADGAGSLGVAVGLKQNDEAALRAVLVALVGSPAGPGGVPPAVPGLKALWNTAKADKTAKTGLFVSKKSEGKTLAASCVNILKPRLGNDWNNSWQNAGFTNGSLAIPANPMTLLQQLRAYFIANPTHEVTGLGLTAAACDLMAGAISTASATSNASNTAAGTAKVALENGIKAARRRLSGLRNELAQLLGDDDERWYTFGFDKPSDPETPEVPENVVLSDLTEGALAIDWDDARRAESYRATVRQIAGGPALATKLVDDSDASFTALPTGVLLRVTVTALNAAGESVASDEATITLAGPLQIPAVPTGLTIETASGGDATVSCPAVPGATSYRFYQGAPGPEQILLTEELTPSKTFNGLPGGTELRMSALNAAGESAQSDPVTVPF